MNFGTRQVNIFDLFAQLEKDKQEVRSSLVEPDVTFKILSLEREKIRRAEENGGYTDYLTMGLDAKFSTINTEKYYNLSDVENEVFRKLNTYFLNKYYDDLFSTDDEKFNMAVEFVKSLVNDKYIFIDKIVRDSRCANLKGMKRGVRPLGLRIEIKDHLGYTATIYTNDVYSGKGMNGSYLGNRREGYHIYFLKYKEILPVFLYLKIIRDYLDNETDIKKEYNNLLENAVEEIQNAELNFGSVASKAVCNFTGIDIVYSLKQFLAVGGMPLSTMNLNSETLSKGTGRFTIKSRYCMLRNIKCRDLISPIFRDILEDYYKNIKCTEYEIERERIMRSDYAASYQDKKTTNKKYLGAAEKSILNKYFSKIEIDTDVDLKLFNEYEKQIAYFYGLFGVKINGLELRLRKLGKHKAAGLFFPHANCLCVDIKNPSSFVHEFFHAIDYNKGAEYIRCHSFMAFKRIHRLYTNKLDNIVKSMDNKNPLKIRLKGSSKYNIDYYKDPYEVFARCGEIYFHELYGNKYSINSDLLNESIFYPIDDDEIVSEIKIFFNNLFKKINKEAV
ncbi:MAG: hypothetical protein PHN69_07605 [Candidatus Pacebacteria bacterium]|nr:hypothetical protein [Candidatus Paceibacterota bacterium]